MSYDACQPMVSGECIVDVAQQREKTRTAQMIQHALRAPKPCEVALARHARHV